MKDKEKVKEIKKIIGRLDTKGPRVINPKKMYKRHQKYQKDFFYELEEQSNFQ